MGVGIRDSWEEIKMKTIGFPISHKENENRRALLPYHKYRTSRMFMVRNGVWQDIAN